MAMRHQGWDSLGKRRVFTELVRPVCECSTKAIGMEVGLDIHAKELKLEEYIKIWTAKVVGGISTVNMLDEFLMSGTAERLRLVPIRGQYFNERCKEYPYEAFVALFYELTRMLDKSHKSWRYKWVERFVVIDSSLLKIMAPFAEYGHSSNTKQIEKGIKIHACVSITSKRIPWTAFVTPANVSDQVMFDSILRDIAPFLTPTSLLLMDKGYFKLERFKQLDDTGIPFVHPMKKGVKYEVLCEKRASEYIDMMVHIESIDHIFRLVKHIDDEHPGYLTNIFCLPPADIIAMYGSRWQIELFFREVRSCLHIERFESRNLNAVMMQIFATLIVYMLLELFATYHGFIGTLSELLRNLNIHIAEYMEWLIPATCQVMRNI